MNLNELNKLWRKTCPDETKGLVINKRRRKIYDKIIKSAESRKRLAELNNKEKD
jgi:hypothetical protein